MWLDKIKAFIKRDFNIEVSYRFNFLLRVARIFITILTFYFISKIFGKGASGSLEEYGGDYFPFVFIGVAFSEYIMVSLRSFSDSIRQEQAIGTLEAVLVTPTKLPAIIIGSSSWDFIFTSISVLIYFLFGVLFFGLDLSNMNLLSAGIILILTICSFSGIGIISGAFVIMLKKGDPLVFFMGTCFSLLGGVYFPVSVMPKFLQIFSFFLPITYSLKGLRMALLRGSGISMLLPDIMALLIFCIVLLPVSIKIFRMALRKAKIDGSLAQY